MSSNRWLALLQIKPDELKVVSLTSLFAFVLGVVQTILFSIPVAMFLARYESTLLPYTYVASGILIAGFGLLFGYLEKKFAVFFVLMIPILIFSVSLFIFWIALLMTESPPLFMALQIWAVVVAWLLMSILPLSCNQLFTLQQNKRLFGLMYSAVMIGGIVLGFSLNTLTTYFGSNQLILFTAILLIIAVALQFGIKQASGTRLLHGEAEGEKTNYKSIKEKKYIKYVFCLTILVHSIYYTFDLLFNASIQKTFPTESEMTAFYGPLFACYDIVGLATGFYISGWVFARFGLIGALLLFPGSLAPLLTLTFLTNLIPSASHLIFPLLTFSSIFSVVIHECIATESILLLVQPLRAAEKTWAQIKNETIIGPLAMSFIGSLLLLMTHFIGILISVTSLIIAALCLCAIWLIVKCIKPGYLNTLNNSLTKSPLINPQLIKKEKSSLDLLKTKIGSKYAEEAIFALKTIEEIDLNELEQAIICALRSASPSVRSYAFNQIKTYKIKSAAPLLRTLCPTEPDALMALGAIDDISPFKANLASKEPQVVCHTMAAFIQYGLLRLEELISMIQSPEDEKRLIAASVLKQIQIEKKADLLIPLLQDKNHAVQCKAFESAIGVENEEIFTLFISKLATPINQIKKEVIGSLCRQETKLTMNVTAHIENNINAIHFLNQLIEPISACSNKLLQGLLEREKEILEECNFSLLTFIYPTKPIRNAQKALQSQDIDTAANGIEILLQLLNHKDQMLITATTTPREISLEQAIEQAYTYADNSCIPSLKAAVIYTIGAIKLKSLAHLIENKQTENHSLMKEIIPWTHSQLT